MLTSLRQPLRHSRASSATSAWCATCSAGRSSLRILQSQPRQRLFSASSVTLPSTLSDRRAHPHSPSSSSHLAGALTPLLRSSRPFSSTPPGHVPPPSTPPASVTATTNTSTPINTDVTSKTVSEKTQAKTDWTIIKKLAVNIWPKNAFSTKVRVVGALGLLVGGKVLNVQVPFFFKDIVDGLNMPITGDTTVWVVAGAAIAGCE